MRTPVLTPVRRWHCPNCGKETVTRVSKVHTQFHPCPRLRGVDIPMVEAGVKAKVELLEWEDYIGKEKVQLDPERGRPIRSVVTTRDNGQDVAVYAPTASITGEM